jgi:uncharacterized membrane protein YecN with MAPEG domain
MCEPRYIKVNEDVFLAARSLEKEADALDLPVYALAEREKARCLSAGDKQQAEFWQAVWVFDKTCEYVPEGTIIVINTRRYV